VRSADFPYRIAFVKTLPYVHRHTLFAREADEMRDESVIADAVDRRRKPQHRDARALSSTSGTFHLGACDHPDQSWRKLQIREHDDGGEKQIIAPVLNALVGDPKKVFEASYGQICEAIRALVERAIKSGDIRKDLDPIDLLRALIGVANVSTSPDWQQSARRLVDILITGSRPG
jgi:hypothetical protein